MENKVRVFLVDNQVVFREGMHLVLDDEEGIEVVGEGTSAGEALAFLENKAVDVLVMSEDTADVARRIKFAFPAVRLIFVGNSHSGDRRAMVGDYSVFLSRDMDPRELVAAVRGAGSKYSDRRTGTDLSKGNVDISDAVQGTDSMREVLKEHFLSMVDAL